MNREYRSGFVSILGSPNVGKSTLMNALVGQKVAIATGKAQTTRNKVTGILTRGEYQIVFLDTPGIHTPKNKLGEYMVRTAYEANRDVDATLLLLDAKVGVGARTRRFSPACRDGTVWSSSTRSTPFPGKGASHPRTAVRAGHCGRADFGDICHAGDGPRRAGGADRLASAAGTAVLSRGHGDGSAGALHCSGN